MRQKTVQVIHPPYAVRHPVVWIVLLVTVKASIFFAGDNERLMIIAFPVFAVAAWYELRWLSQWLKIPATHLPVTGRSKGLVHT